MMELPSGYVPVEDSTREALLLAQDAVEDLAPRDYYRDQYRGMESVYLPEALQLALGIWPGLVVDVGPGWGTMSVALSRRGWDVHQLDCVDLGTFETQELLDLWDLRYHQCRIETGDALPELPPADLVLMTMVCGHLRWRPDAAIRNVARYLAPGGTFLTCNIDGARFAIDTAFGSWRSMPEVGTTPAVPDLATCEFTESDYRELLEMCFERVTVFADPRAAILYGVAQQPRRS